MVPDSLTRIHPSASVEEVGEEDAEVSHGSGNEDCDEEVLLGSFQLDDDLDVVDSGDGIWERRRSGVIKFKRLVKIQEAVQIHHC